jgi:signal transduction histidine kinase
MLWGMKTRPFGRLLALADRRQNLTDAAIAAGFVVFGLASLATAPPRATPPAVEVALVLALFAPLAWRRRFPLAALVAFTAVFAVLALIDLPLSTWFGNGWLVAAYSAAVHGRGRWRTPVGTATAVVFLVALVGSVVVQEGVPGNPVLGVALLIAGNAAFVVWVWLFGDATHNASERQAELAERTRQLERERETNARRAVLAERVRIARELHDVVAHHVSLMGVQAGAARRVLRQRPDQAEQALAAIETASREAVGEMHRLLGFLRQEPETDGLEPPTMRCLDRLLDQFREAGLPVALAVEGDERPLPPAVDLSAYRIVQEALTNTLRHAGPASASVHLRYGPRELLIEVVDDGRAAGNGAAGGAQRDAGKGGAAGVGTGGAGLLGMHERVGLLGGWLRLERPPGGGFAVRAALPTDGASR